MEENQEKQGSDSAVNGQPKPIQESQQEPTPEPKLQVAEQPKPSMPSMPSSSTSRRWILLTFVFVALFLLSFFTPGFSLNSITGSAVISQDEALQVSDDFISSYLTVPGVDIVINEISEESGLYRLDVTATSNGQSQEAQAYISKDGRLFFLQAIPLDEVEALLQPPTLEEDTTIDEDLLPPPRQKVILGKDNVTVVTVEDEESDL